jgi:uncharacterized protein (TIGR03435 family)
MRTKFVLALLVTALGVNAEDALPSFTAASIRPSDTPVPFERDGRIEISPGYLRMRDVRVFTCIKWAYGIQDNQIEGPAWLQSEHYDILARAEGGAGESQMKLMMRTLLADRVQFKFHTEKRPMNGYALTLAKTGHKLKAARAGTEPRRENTESGVIARALTMGEFANFIAGPLRTPVVDMTGLDGCFDFDLDFSPYIPTDGQRVDPASLFIGALRDESGLKLESQRTTVEVFVIDQVEKPSAN